MSILVCCTVLCRSVMRLVGGANARKQEGEYTRPSRRVESGPAMIEMNIGRSAALHPPVSSSRMPSVFDMYKYRSRVGIQSMCKRISLADDHPVHMGHISRRSNNNVRRYPVGGKEGRYLAQTCGEHLATSSNTARLPSRDARGPIHAFSLRGSIVKEAVVRSWKPLPIETFSGKPFNHGYVSLQSLIGLFQLRVGTSHRWHCRVYCPGRSGFPASMVETSGQRADRSCIASKSSAESGASGEGSARLG